MVKRTKKIMEKPMETAMKAGVVDVGAVSMSGAPLGRADRSIALCLEDVNNKTRFRGSPYSGDRVGIVQETSPSLLVREQEPYAW